MKVKEELSLELPYAPLDVIYTTNTNELINA